MGEIVSELLGYAALLAILAVLLFGAGWLLGRCSARDRRRDQP